MAIGAFAMKVASTGKSVRTVNIFSEISLEIEKLAIKIETFLGFKSRGKLRYPDTGEYPKKAQKGHHRY